MTAKKDSPANLQEEFAATLLFGDCRSARMGVTRRTKSVLDKAFKMISPHGERQMITQ
jgi:hypothetical protein